MDVICGSLRVIRDLFGLLESLRINRILKNRIHPELVLNTSSDVSG